MNIYRLFPWLLAALIATPMNGVALADQDKRPIYVISDLHMGVGHTKGDNGYVLEDFRWPRAFDGFLRQISNEHPKGVDLVIAGDLLDLWQHPTVACAKLRDTECGCSMEEMKQIVKDVISGHQAEFNSLGRFLSGTQNRVIVIPGNHDVALMEEEIWQFVARAVPAGQERLMRVKSEAWFSSDGKICIEHGHQYTFDVNRFPDWPNGITKACKGGKRFFRTGGENFVQSLFNDKEALIPLIDNLVPESMAISIYSQYSDLKGKKSEDIARLAIFVLLQTSFYQKLQWLKIKSGERDKKSTDQIIDFCRRCMGEDVVLGSEEGQRYRTQAGITGAEQEKEFRLAMREQIASLDDDAFRELCLRAADRSKGELKANPDMATDPNCSKPLGYGASKLFDPKGENIRKKRIAKWNEEQPGMHIYVFGHTHESTISEAVLLVETEKTINAFNTGAFQRLMDKEYFNNKRQKKEDDVKLLGRLKHDDMKPCYPFLEILYDKQGIPTAQLKQWYQEESFWGNGEFLNSCDDKCSAMPARCPRMESTLF